MAIVNVTLGGGKAVHAAQQIEDFKPSPECGGNRATERYRITDAEVTCKRCLKWLAQLAPVVEAVETEAPAEATQTCGTCGEVTTVKCTDGFTKIFVSKCSACVADEAKADDALFEATLKAEAAVQGEKATAALGVDITTRARAMTNLKTARVRLASLIDAMSLDQLKAYGEFRKAQRA